MAPTRTAPMSTTSSYSSSQHGTTTHSSSESGSAGGNRPWLNVLARQQPLATGIDAARLDNVWAWNVGLTILHAVQGVAIMALGTGFRIPITAAFPDGPPGSALPAPGKQFNVDVGVMVGVFLLLAALDHGLTASVFRGRYEKDLALGINRFRWIEYAISATIMISLISLYTGMTQFVTQLGVIGCNVSMIMFGHLQEKMNPPSRTETTYTPFIFGCFAGIIPWIGLWFQIIGSSTVPGFVYGIIISEFILFFSFGVNQLLQYLGVGWWASYGFGEKVYLVLSLVAKSVLAWQIYGGSLSDDE
ncbi:uncharacterized protein AMSG_02642 [Thecamonas trahens ATCC 50062]|uniref:Integral membrane protein n=1 Tax=Thecamonas trahens ATCC 50062 TaxID=461836 RepID=A0A0L0D8K8_THETB|nr:integral membrane protein [Thecamonas trahens ATCC 50062]KNC47618.1 integral membrane protein [Thecamonas trahens ATCC 50062]|eukprot:XP_013759543.1 integral membrane protein [Thecamonas trahens ATCC 50062]